jgi:hypothetical protein
MVRSPHTPLTGSPVHPDATSTPDIVLAHDGKDGIGGNEGIEWPELMEALIPLNRLTRSNLVVILRGAEIRHASDWNGEQ